MALEKLLITGASGVIGKVLVPKLAESYDVYSVDQNLTEVPGRLFKADLSDYEQIASVISAISDPRIIVHLAADANADAAWQAVLKNNIVATRNLFEAGKEKRVKRIVFASSNHVTGGYEGIPSTQRTSSLESTMGHRTTKGDFGICPMRNKSLIFIVRTTPHPSSPVVRPSPCRPDLTTLQH
jgi:nucleoside-diphosphate-sugar epimerase